MLTILGELPASRIGDLESVDLVIAACGYESRARAFAEQFEFATAKRVSFLFAHQRVLGFSENQALFLKKGYSLSLQTEDSVRSAVLELLGGLRSKQPESAISIFVDISSQSRSRLAAIVEALSIAGERLALRVVFGYSLAQYSEPAGTQAPNVDIGPVTPFFAGWATDPELPVSLVLGLGYEPDRGLGAVEYLEPAAVWPFLPHSKDSRYDRSLREANSPLLEQIGSDHLTIYEVEDPNAALAMLASLVGHLTRDSVVLMLPSGPKILVLLCLLLACDRHDIGVWRVSAGANDPAVDRRPTGRSILFECRFEPAPAR